MTTEAITFTGFENFMRSTASAYALAGIEAQAALDDANKAADAFSKRESWMRTGIQIGEITTARAVEIEVSASKGVAKKEWALDAWTVPPRAAGADGLRINTDKATMKEKPIADDATKNTDIEELVVKLSADTSEFEAALKRVTDLTKGFGKLAEATFGGPTSATPRKHWHGRRGDWIAAGVANGFIGIHAARSIGSAGGRL